MEFTTIPDQSPFAFNWHDHPACIFCADLERAVGTHAPQSEVMAIDEAFAAGRFECRQNGQTGAEFEIGAGERFLDVQWP